MAAVWLGAGRGGHGRSQVVASLTEGSKGRLQELVHQEFRRRLLAREDGSHAQDCQVLLSGCSATGMLNGNAAADRDTACFVLSAESEQDMAFFVLHAPPAALSPIGCLLHPVAGPE